MDKTTVKRIGVGLNAEDIGVLEKLQARFGLVGPTAIIRMALRALERTQ